MVKIGRVSLGKIPRIAFSVAGFSPSLGRFARRGVAILEARVDRFRRLDPAFVAGELRKIRRVGLPVICTVRSRREGGSAAIPDARRLELFQAAAPLVHALDIELSSSSILKRAARIARKNRNTLIVSFHDFRRTPAPRKLEAILRRAKTIGADIVKIAAFARNESDVARLFSFTLRHRGKNLANISMGGKGSVSRVTFFSAGSLLTYTSASPADGQIALPKLVSALRRNYPQFR